MSSSIKSIGAVALAFATVLTAHAFVPQGQPTTPQHPVTRDPVGAPVVAGGSAGGRGGGRGNPMAAIYTERCAGCHGPVSKAAARRACSMRRWMHGDDDESIRKTIHDGIAGTEMVGFEGSLSDSKSGSLSAYLRTQGARRSKANPTYVPDPDGQIIKSEKQTFKIEVVAGNSRRLGSRVPARRPAADYRAARPPAHRRERQAAARAGEGHAEGVGEAGRRAVRRRSASAVREERLDLFAYSEPGPYTAAPRRDSCGRRRLLRRPGAPQPDAARGAAAGAFPQGGGRGRGGPPDPPSMTVIVRGKINKNNEWTDEQVIFRAKPELYTPSNAHYGSRFIFDKQTPLLHARREGQMPERAGPVESARQDPSRQRRRFGAEGQSVRRERQRGADDLELRPSQPAGAGLGSGDRQALGIGAWPAGRRRDQHHRARA